LRRITSKQFHTEELTGNGIRGSKINQILSTGWC